MSDAPGWLLVSPNRLPLVNPFFHTQPEREDVAPLVTALPDRKGGSRSTKFSDIPPTV